MGRGGTHLHHGCIALFLVAPIAVLKFHFGLSSILLRKSAGMSHSSMRDSKRWIVASLILAGTVASAVYFYTVAGALLARDGDVSLVRLFVPASGFADPIESLSKTNGLPAEYAALLENPHLFSQWDWVVVSLTSIVFADLLLSRRDGVDRGKLGEANTPT
ncbi:hypothetical protein CDEST_12809 [Colletotrichum destructivum]|uniref:Uncharacterized protein n=1 Tax=Colletotrichum destructivum TaxID=34406 RepID=A0AAX4IX17_9PEZI|nr:hypothetical protein CDEST_12809 [Colletotrichum destructivum]